MRGGGRLCRREDTKGVDTVHRFYCRIKSTLCVVLRGHKAVRVAFPNTTTRAQRGLRRQVL